jgi:hypothetical protein
MKQQVSMPWVIAVIVGVLLVIGVVKWASQPKPLAGPASASSGPAPEPNIPRPGMYRGGIPR